MIQPGALPNLKRAGTNAAAGSRISWLLDWSQKPGVRSLLSILSAVFVLKLAVMWQLKDHVLTQPDAGLDTTVYVGLARRVLAGDLALGPGLYFVSPLYVYFLAIVLGVTDSFFAVRVLQIALGTAAVALVYVAANEWYGWRAAVLAAILATLTGLLTFYESLLLQAALDPFLTAASMACLAIAFKRGSRSWYALAGLAFGIQTLNRPNIAVAAIGIVVLLAITGRRRMAAVLMAAMMAAVAPVAIRNFVVAGEWSVLSSHGGLNFYIGNHPQADGTYVSVPGITPNLEGQQNDARRVAEQAMGRTLADAEASSYFYRLGWMWITEHPGDAARLFGRKLWLIFSGAYVWLNYSFPFFAYDTPTLMSALRIGPWFLIPMGVFGLLMGGPAASRGEYLIWSSFVPLYALSVAVFFVADRYTLALLIPLTVGAGAALDRGWRLLSEKHWGQLGFATVPCLIALGLANISPPVEDGTAEERTRMAERLITLGRYEDAQYWSERAQRTSRHPGIVAFRLGQRLLARGDTTSAIRYFEAALKFDPGQPEVEYVLGETLLDAGRPQEAAVHLQRALDTGFAKDKTRLDLVRALGAAGDRDRALGVLQNARPLQTGDGAAWVTLGELAMQLRAAELAERFFAEAIKAAPDLVPAHFGLAAANAALGRPAEAHLHLQDTLRLDPGFEPARQLQRMLR